MGKLLFNIKNDDKFLTAKMVINNFYEFFKSIEIPMHLKELGIDEKE
jgi:alcohol dehydrogenase YqhD (iron-dependent ADH family)